MLWRLATNTEYRTIAALFGVGILTVCSIVHKTAQIVAEFLLPKYVCIPPEDKLKEIVAEFESLWGFPQVVGAIDGTHIPILHPQEIPSDYYNWKNFYSIIMQAVVDSWCCFVDVNIGWPGKVHVLSNSSFFSPSLPPSLPPSLSPHLLFNSCKVVLDDHTPPCNCYGCYYSQLSSPNPSTPYVKDQPS